MAGPRRPTLRGGRSALARLPAIFAPPKPVFRRGPRALQAALLDVPTPQFPPPSGDWATKPLTEWAIYWVLTSVLRKIEDVDFTYQDSFLGGRKHLGGLVVDFLMYNPPNIAINPLGLFFHYDRGAATIARDQLQKAQLATYGIREIFIDEPADYAQWDVIGLVKDALLGIDHSRHALGAV
jgi:hypothetical protein